MVRGSFVALVVFLAAAAPSRAETVNFETSAAKLAESCGKDIDENCYGVSFDAPRLRECLARAQDSVSQQCRTDYVKVFDAIQKRVSSRAAVWKTCERDKQKFCAAETQVGPADALACLAKVPRGVSWGCKQAIGEAGYR
jgi:hypothetical protein